MQLLRIALLRSISAYAGFMNFLHGSISNLKLLNQVSWPLGIFVTTAIIFGVISTLSIPTLVVVQLKCKENYLDTCVWQRCSFSQNRRQPTLLNASITVGSSTISFIFLGSYLKQCAPLWTFFSTAMLLRCQLHLNLWNNLTWLGYICLSWVYETTSLYYDEDNLCMEQPQVWLNYFKAQTLVWRQMKWEGPNYARFWIWNIIS